MEKEGSEVKSTTIVRAAVVLAYLGCTSDLPAGQGKVWHPTLAAADAPVEAARVRIVDFGADFLRGGDGPPRHHFHCRRYILVQDEKTKLWRPNDRPVQNDLRFDVDGDGPPACTSDVTVATCSTCRQNRRST